MRDQNYSGKIIILFAATFTSIFVIWYALVRDQSANWITDQIVHQVSPYAVTTLPNGQVIIDNVVIGYEFSLPEGFETTGARNFNFFMEEAGRKKCEIRHYYVNADRAKELSPDDKKAVILFNNKKLVFEIANKNEISDCGKYLLEVKSNLVEN